MSLTQQQVAAAEAQQWAAARDNASHVRLVAGPGTGKTHAIQKKVLEILKSGARPENIYVISFTRATCAELKDRISKYCGSQGFGEQVEAIHLSTMHSLGLHILRKGNQLNNFPSEPTVLDDWEQTRVYDAEFSSSVLGCTPTRAKKIRQAYDAAWDTLAPEDIDERGITDGEKTFFTAFHSARTRLYSCVLPGEIIFRCVEALKLGALQESQLPNIDYLIVDEYQDLNKCDQKFIKLLCNRGAKLFVAGDDDQSIYTSLRHAHPAGIVHFEDSYPNFAAHDLTDCFRCAPAIVEPALRLIAVNPDRITKQLIPLYGAAAPPVNGILKVWSFTTAEEEAKSVALSCKRLIDAGMKGQESEIVILLSNRKVQLDILTRELSNLGLPFDAPVSKSSEEDVIRAVYCLLRISKSLREKSQNKADREKKLDYPAYRSLLCLLTGVGPTTAKELSNLCINNGANYHELFHREKNPHWLTGRPGAAVDRVRQIVRAIKDWDLSDVLQGRGEEIVTVLRDNIFVGSPSVEEYIVQWLEFSTAFLPEMELAEILEYLSSNSGSDQEIILKLVNERVGNDENGVSAPKQHKIRLLTMHGAKGLSGKVVFIPSASSGIMPSFRDINAVGLLIEKRRLFYVSLTRAKAACIISHATKYTGAPAQAIAQRSTVHLTRSEFLSDMQAVSVNRDEGLTEAEAQEIMGDVMNL